MPQDVFVGWSTLEMGVASAVVSFNDRQSDIFKVMENLSMNPSENCIRYCNEREVRHRRK